MCPVYLSEQGLINSLLLPAVIQKSDLLEWEGSVQWVPCGIHRSPWLKIRIASNYFTEALVMLTCARREVDSLLQCSRYLFDEKAVLFQEPLGPSSCWLCGWLFQNFYLVHQCDCLVIVGFLFGFFSPQFWKKVFY